jgi:hypothetical protein
MEGTVHLYLSLEAVACLKIPYPFVFQNPHDSVGILPYKPPRPVLLQLVPLLS